MHDNKKVGFPNTIFDKVKSEIEKNCISYQVIDIDQNPIIVDFKDKNQYINYYNKAINNYDNNQKINIIIEKIKEASSDKIDTLIDVVTKCLE